MGLTYNSKNENIFDVTDEKTDYRTDYKTDYDTDPNRVTKQEARWEKTSCAFRFFGRCVRHNRGWVYYAVPDNDKIRRHQEMNEGNTQTNNENSTLNANNMFDLELRYKLILN